jgi:hypothetical protein
MYARNAASPQRIAVGAVVQISDGAVQTSGVSVKVLPQGASAGAGGGTIAYEEGILHYLPTQAETDYTSFIVIAYKTGCIPISATVVTSASAVSGYAGLDWSKIASPTTSVALTGTTIDTDAIPTATENADALLNRDMSAVSDTNARSPLNALRFLRNKWAITGTTLSVKKENDSTEAWTAEVTPAPGGDPISGNDPA